MTTPSTSCQYPPIDNEEWDEADSEDYVNSDDYTSVDEPNLFNQ